MNYTREQEDLGSIWSYNESFPLIYTNHHQYYDEKTHRLYAHRFCHNLYLQNLVRKSMKFRIKIKITKI